LRKVWHGQSNGIIPGCRNFGAAEGGRIIGRIKTIALVVTKSRVLTWKRFVGTGREELGFPGHKREKKTKGGEKRERGTREKNPPKTKKKSEKTLRHWAPFRARHSALVRNVLGEGKRV